MRTVLLYGLWGTPNRLNWLRRGLQRHGLDPVDIHSFNASGMVSIEALAEEFLERHAGGGPLRVVAHSMGGLVLRTALLLSPGLDLRRAVFINSPHAGTLAAYLLPFRGIRQMRPDSPLLAKLREQNWNIPSLAIWCPGDLMVVPGHNAKWDGASEMACCNTPAHIWPLFSRRWHRRIAEFLCMNP